IFVDPLSSADHTKRGGRPEQEAAVGTSGGVLLAEHLQQTRNEDQTPVVDLRCFQAPVSDGFINLGSPKAACRAGVRDGAGDSVDKGNRATRAHACLSFATVRRFWRELANDSERAC